MRARFFFTSLAFLSCVLAFGIIPSPVYAQTTAPHDVTMGLLTADPPSPNDSVVYLARAKNTVGISKIELFQNTGNGFQKIHTCSYVPIDSPVSCIFTIAEGFSAGENVSYRATAIGSGSTPLSTDSSVKHFTVLNAPGCAGSFGCQIPNDCSSKGGTEIEGICTPGLVCCTNTPPEDPPSEDTPKNVGLIPCGAEGQDPCTLCHSFALVDNIIRFFLIPDRDLNNGFAVVPLLATLLVAIGGFFMFMGAASPENLNRGRSIIFAVIIGLLITYGAWLFISTFLTVLGVMSWTGLNTWFELTCTLQ
jgi:hypothetical protein